jgi:hypothetical protein
MAARLGWSAASPLNGVEELQERERMRFGVIVPNFGDYFDPRKLADLACAAEEAG